MGVNVRSRDVDNYLRDTKVFERDGKVFNDKGLSALPAEIYLEIASHVERVPLPNIFSPQKGGFPYLPGICRQQVFATLSETCRSLRQAFLPCLWERIEVFDGMLARSELGYWDHLPSTDHNSPYDRLFVQYDPPGSRDHSMELLRQLEVILTKNTELGKYVREINLVVTGYATERIFFCLLKAMSLLPSLHTIQIWMDINPKSYQRLEELIKSGYSFPAIRRLSLSPNAEPFLRACPNATQIVAYENQYINSFLAGALVHCPRVEVLGTFLAADASFLAAKKLLCLRDIAFDHLSLPLIIFREELRNISLYEHTDLTTIRLHLWFSESIQEESRLINRDNLIPERMEIWLGWARDVLERCFERRRKTFNSENRSLPNVVIQNMDGKVDIHELRVSSGKIVWEKRAGAASEAFPSLW